MENVCFKECFLIVPENTVISSAIKESNKVLYSKNPRLDYAVILPFILGNQKMKRDYSTLPNIAVIGENVVIGKETKIEPFVFIDHDVTIGENCLIKSGAKIGSNVIIGNNLIIGENSVIGQNGLVLRFLRMGVQ